ncbi:MAG: Sulfate/thiosulfate import ATP-binding protein CysA [Flavobacterium sp. SCGC AAA160-P02]|nr:MAG: Sulfate/thiosulfate import ATP-binding protein CysA [Flavobacterium sp. SCGC AAA160-P02]
MGIVVDIKGLQKSYTKGNPVLCVDELSIQKGTTTAVVGESGSGKTTLMRLIAGLESPELGSISLYGTIFTNPKKMVSPEKRQVGMVFQDHALFPHLTIYNNLAFGLSDKECIKDRVLELLSLVNLEGFENRYPHELSGGQQQRIALARALAPKPKILILDEPFSNLDTSLKLQLRNEVFSILKKTDITTLFITHDMDDAIYIADEIVVLKNGKIIQQGTIEELYNQPENLYIASLFSVLQILNFNQLEIFGYIPDKQKLYAIRQSDFKVNKESEFITDGIIIKSSYRGTDYLYTVKISNKYTFEFVSPQKLEGTIRIGFQKEDLLIFKNS